MDKEKINLSRYITYNNKNAYISYSQNFIEPYLKEILDNTKPKKVSKITKICKWIKRIFNPIIKFLISLALALGIMIPITDSYNSILNNKNSVLDYSLNNTLGISATSNIVSNSTSNAEHQEIPYPHYTYDFDLSISLKINKGDLKAAYFVYGDYNQALEENNFHKIDYTYDFPNYNPALRAVNTGLPIVKDFSHNDYSETININQRIEYFKGKNDSTKFNEPIYLVMIDKNNNISIADVIVAHAEPVIMTTLNEKTVNGKRTENLAVDTRNHPVNLKVYKGTEVLDSQENPVQKNKLWITGNQYSSDSSKIQSIIKNYFTN